MTASKSASQKVAALAGAMLCLASLSGMAIDRQDTLIQTTGQQTGQASYWENMAPEAAAKEWNLPMADWMRYQQLMQGKARTFASDMPPPMVLAMYADTDQDLDRFAEMLAKHERDKANRILKVQRAYDRAMNRLYPNEKIIDLELLRQQGMRTSAESQLLEKPDPRTPTIGDTMVLFATADCATCADRIRTIVARYSLAPLEVYFSGDPSAFKQWVEKSAFELTWLKANRVTFAKDEGQAKQYEAAPGTAFIVRGKSLYEMQL